MADGAPPPPRPSASLDRRARIVLPLLIAVLAGLTAYRLYWAPALGPHVEFAGPTMGTTYMVKVASSEIDLEAQRSIAATIERELALVNGLMSTWDPDSEISRFNRLRSSDPFPVSPETFEVLRVSREVSELSGGAFDVTVAPLVRAWGFGAKANAGPLPTPERLTELRAEVGYQMLILDADTHRVTKLQPELECDLSAVAKGYAVDRVSNALAALGFENHLVEVGGELRSRGRRLDGQPWRVAVERPADDGPDSLSRRVHQIIALENRAIATSGDYRNYYELDGQRISHTIDPRDGHPLRHSVASVSVVHAEAVHADALATALNVLGEEAGYSLAARLGLAAAFIMRSPDDTEGGQGALRFRTLTTPAFDTLVDASKPEAAPDTGD